jgi:hypothetical protein
MLTAKDREEIKQLVGAMIAESGASASRQRRDGANMALLESDPIVDVLARAIEVSELEKKRCGGLGRLCDRSVTRRPSPF